MNAFVENMVLEAVRRQPWWQRYSNTVVAGIGALAALLSFVATFNLPIKDEWAGIIPAAISVLTAVSIKLTKSGLAPSAADKLSPVADEAVPADTGVYSGPTSVPNITPNSSGLPVYQIASSAVDTLNDTRQRFEVAVSDTAESLHDQGMQLGQEVQNVIGRHRAS